MRTAPVGAHLLHRQPLAHGGSAACDLACWLGRQSHPNFGLGRLSVRGEPPPVRLRARPQLMASPGYARGHGDSPSIVVTPNMLGYLSFALAVAGIAQRVSSARLRVPMSACLPIALATADAWRVICGEVSRNIVGRRYPLRQMFSGQEPATFPHRSVLEP
ncbi:hypothetical protein NL676_016162 [Syzygium grande]|nr:hypothetical protein NL676_016162 [Syzygium grande]